MSTQSRSAVKNRDLSTRPQFWAPATCGFVTKNQVVLGSSRFFPALTTAAIKTHCPKAKTRQHPVVADVQRCPSCLLGGAGEIKIGGQKRFGTPAPRNPEGFCCIRLVLQGFLPVNKTRPRGSGSRPYKTRRLLHPWALCPLRQPDVKRKRGRTACAIPPR